ncbi:PREDICTED: mucin-6-like [Elephantulus edwardii]|uniref:mucin-6-like n=1 Tax=Elephantulus edwardii TaxID=28737 RepID=UPI0003F0778F|nr:PREDICTED: mucin-6-like [Elephantulus edwardii]
MPSSLFSTQSTSLSTPLTTHTPTPGFVSSSLGVTTSASSPATILTSQPSPSGLLTTVLMTSSITAHSSSSVLVPESSTPGPSSSAGTSLPNPSGVCSVKEWEEEITYQGCTANVTVTRCEGVCISSASFDISTSQVVSSCGCCYPLRTYKKQLVLPCPDPTAPGGKLVLPLLVFSSCACVVFLSSRVQASELLAHLLLAGARVPLEDSRSRAA